MHQNSDLALGHGAGNEHLGKLHNMIQAVMVWTDSHLHEFESAGARFGIPNPGDDFGEPVMSKTRVRLRKSLKDTVSFHYVYDFGDDWEHKIRVEKVLPEDACPVPMFIGGANANRKTAF